MDPLAPFGDDERNVLASIAHVTAWQQADSTAKLTLAQQANAVQRQAQNAFDQLQHHTTARTKALQEKKTATQPCHALVIVHLEIGIV